MIKLEVFTSPIRTKRRPIAMPKNTFGPPALLQHKPEIAKIRSLHDRLRPQ